MKTLPLIGLLMCFAHAGVCHAATGQEIWAAQCAKCHGADGRSQTPMGKKLQIKDFSDAKVQAEMQDDAMLKNIRNGKQNSAGRLVMQPAENVSDDDVKALVQVVRGFKQ